jgi:hypothetical protein
MELTEYDVEIASCNMIHVVSFLKIDADIQAILRFSLRDLRGYSAGITDERDLCVTSLRWSKAQ